MTDLIEFLDKCAALRGMPREDRIRSAIVDLRAIYPDLPALLGVHSLGALSHPNDDGKPWGRIDPETGEWSEMAKAPILAANSGPAPCYYTAPDGRLFHVVHEPPRACLIDDPECEACQ